MKVFTLKKDVNFGFNTAFVFFIHSRILEFSDLTEVPAFFYALALVGAFFNLEMILLKYDDKDINRVRYFTEYDMKKITDEERRWRRKHALLFDIVEIVNNIESLSKEEVEKRFATAVRLYYL